LDNSVQNGHSPEANIGVISLPIPEAENAVPARARKLFFGDRGCEEEEALEGRVVSPERLQNRLAAHRGYIICANAILTGATLLPKAAEKQNRGYCNQAFVLPTPRGVQGDASHSPIIFPEFRTR